MMKIDILFFIICWFFHHVTMADKSETEKTQLNLSVLKTFDDGYSLALLNKSLCETLQSRASIYANLCSIKNPKYMSVRDLKENFICFCSTLPDLSVREQTAEWIYASVFVQYSAIKTIFSFAVCRIYNLHALKNYYSDQTNSCEKVALYMDIFRSIMIDDRLTEIGRIYRLSLVDADQFEFQKEVFDQYQLLARGGLNILKVKKHLKNLHFLLNKFRDIVAPNGSQRTVSVPCEESPILWIPLKPENEPDTPILTNLYLDFYSTASEAPLELDMIKAHYDNEEDEDDYLTYYYHAAWKNILENFYSDFCPLFNYFNKSMYGDDQISCTNDTIPSLIPSMEESLEIWRKADTLMSIFESETKDSRSNVISILRVIELTTASSYDILHEPARPIQLEYSKNRDMDFYVKLKNYE